MRKNDYEEELEEEFSSEEDEEIEYEEDIQSEKKSHKFLNLILLIMILLVGGVMYSKYVATKGLIVKEYRVESSILSSNFSGLKIVHFSDLLYKSTVDKDNVKTLIEKINILKPDIIVFSGNLVTSEVKITNEDSDFLKEELSKLEAKINKYAVYGSDDYNYKDYEKVLTSSGFKILNNEYDSIYYKSNEPMYIVGIPSSSKENVDLKKSFDFYKEEDRKYIISIIPDGKTIKYLDDSTYEVDLILSGTSLNGSVVMPIYGGIFKNDLSYKYSSPHYEKGITNIYVSSGLGTRKYGYRLFNTPSFNLYRLKAQS